MLAWPSEAALLFFSSKHMEAPEGCVEMAAVEEKNSDCSIFSESVCLVSDDR